MSEHDPIVDHFDAIPSPTAFAFTAEPLPSFEHANRPPDWAAPFVTITRPAHGIYRVTAVKVDGTVTTSEWALIDHAIMNAKDAIHATL